MAQTRVLSIRFAEEEYKLLQALSVITDKPINALVRESVAEKATRAVDDPDFLDLAEQAKRRVADADRALRENLQTHG